MSHEAYQKTLSAQLATWQQRRARRLSDELLNAALLLLRLDLEPCRPLLRQLYATSHRGRPPFDPVSLLRALLLMTALGYERFTTFAVDLKAKPRLALIAGFQPHHTPAASTFYLFIDRLEDGPYTPDCRHRTRPSQLRKQPRLRQLRHEKEEQEHRRKQILAQSDSITHQLRDELLPHTAQPRPLDLLHRLEDFLIQTAVIPSAHRGLLGELNKLVICGDGSALVTGASSAGRPSCQCRQQGTYRCDCPRFYSDATANWGYDSYRECYYFGHTFYQYIVAHGGHDLPLHVSIGQASETDFTLSMKAFDRMRQAFTEHQLKVDFYAAVHDSGHDARGIYEFLLAHKVRPVIVLNPRTGGTITPSGTAAQINAEGIPLCPAGLAMRRHSVSPNHRIYYNCPVKRPTHQDGQQVWKAHPDECPHKVLCQPESKMGPIVYLRSDTDPRLYPPIARDSAQFKTLLKLRTGCERSNATKKTVHKLERRPCRSATHFLVRLSLISVLEHAKAWLAEDRKTLGQDWRKLSDPRLLKEPLRT